MPVSCGLCGADQPRELHAIRGLNIVACSACGCIYTHPRPAWDYSARRDDFEQRLRLYRTHYLPARQASYDRVWQRLDTYRQQGRLLDVGSGYGFFLKEAQARGWKAVGVEPDAGQEAWARRNFDGLIVDSIFSEALEPGGFDVITMWDVIEHVPDIWPFVRRSYGLLRPGGLLLAKTPNAEGLLLNGPPWLRPCLFFYRHLVYPANPWQHCYHFTPSVLSEVLGKVGFQVVAIDTKQTLAERVIVGVNRAAYLTRKLILVPIAWRLSLPYEFVMLAEKNQNGAGPFGETGVGGSR